MVDTFSSKLSPIISYRPIFVTKEIRPTFVIKVCQCTELMEFHCRAHRSSSRTSYSGTLHIYTCSKFAHHKVTKVALKTPIKTCGDHHECYRLQFRMRLSVATKSIFGDGQSTSTDTFATLSTVFWRPCIRNCSIVFLKCISGKVWNHYLWSWDALCVSMPGQWVTTSPKPLPAKNGCVRQINGTKGCFQARTHN